MNTTTKPTKDDGPVLGFCTWLLRGRSLPGTVAFLAEAGYRSVAFLQDVMGVRGSEREEAAAAIRELGFSIIVQQVGLTSKRVQECPKELVHLSSACYGAQAAVSTSFGALPAVPNRKSGDCARC